MDDSRGKPSNFAWLGAVVVVSVWPFNHHQGTNRFSIDDRIACSAGSCYVMLQGERRLLYVQLFGLHAFVGHWFTDRVVSSLHSRDHFWYQHLLHSDCFFILDMYKRCYVNARTLNNKPRPGQTFSNTFTIMSDFAKLRYCKHRATTMRSIVDSFSWFLIVWLCLVGSGLIQRPKALFFYVHFWQFLALCHVLCARNKSAILSGPAPRYFFSCAKIYANMSLDVDDM